MFYLWILIVGILFNNSNILKRAFEFTSLFNKDKIVHNFRTMNEKHIPYHYLKHKKNISEFYVNKSYNKLITLPNYFTHNNAKHNLNKWLDDHWTTGLVVLKIDNVTNARLLHEKYYLGNNKKSKVISWSTGKSITSLLVGLAIQDGYIKSINDKVSEYINSLSDCAYGNITIKNLLQMSSGIKFDENYFDTWADINVMLRQIIIGNDLENYVKTLQINNIQGTTHNYISADTQILGMVVRNAINETLTNYLQRKVWNKGGFECDLYWLHDNHKLETEFAFGTINTCTRDYARIGWLYLNNGKSPLDGKQIINEKWIVDSVTPDSSHLMPGVNKFPLGYGYQWWVPGCEHNITQICDDYLAIGIYNQFIYVSPKNKIVIAKNSAYVNYDKDSELSELESISMFRTIANKLKQY